MEHRGGDIPLVEGVGPGGPQALPQRDPRGQPPPYKPGEPKALPQRQFFNINNKRQVIHI